MLTNNLLLHQRKHCPMGFESEQTAGSDHSMRGMVINMNDEQLHSLAQLQAFLDGTITVDFAVVDDERYDFILGGLCHPV